MFVTSTAETLIRTNILIGYILVLFTSALYMYKPIKHRVLSVALIADSSTKMADTGDEDKRLPTELNGM